MRLELEDAIDVHNSNQDTIRISYNIDQQRKSRVIYSVKKQEEIEGIPQNRFPFLYTAEELEKSLHSSLNRPNVQGGGGMRYSANNPVPEVTYPGGFAASQQIKPNSDLFQQIEDQENGQSPDQVLQTNQTKRFDDQQYPSNLNKEEEPMHLNKVNFSKIMITVGSKD